KKVTLYGAASTLKDIVQLDVDVNLAGIVHNTSKKVRLKLPKGVVKADPSDIWVKIEMADISAIKN
ncbi:MAG: CdaR family protein, partial [Lactobacillus iners]|nr:CdaR family protein [Lactobacillus iners]